MFKVVAIVIVAIGVAVLLNHVIVEIKTTIRWLCAAIFLALALSPLVELIERIRVRGAHPAALAGDPRRLRALLRGPHLPGPRGDPADHRRGRAARSKLAHGYVKDFEQWANDNDQFRELNHKYHITSAAALQEASQLPSKLGDAAGALQEFTVGLLNHLVEGDRRAHPRLLPAARRRSHVRADTSRLRAQERERVAAGVVAAKIAGIVRSYVTVNLLPRGRSPASSPGWRSSCSASISPCRSASSSAILDLVPLIGFTVGGLLVAVVAAPARRSPTRC